MKTETSGKTKRAIAYEKIKDMIISGEIEDGTFISERTLSELIGFSRTPVKAALTQLEKDGLLKEFPKRGFMVASLSYQDVREIYEIRRVLDPLALKLVLISDRDDIKQSMLKEIEEMKKAVEAGDYENAALHDTTFHDLYLKNVNNERLRRFIGTIHEEVNMIVNKTRKETRWEKQFSEEHEAIADAIRRNDIDGAVEAMEKHMESSYDFQLSYYR